MQFYLAPLEGITTHIYRRAFFKYYGGVDKYFTPFITSATMSHRERQDVLPENNEGMELVPQILTNKSEEFLEIAKALQDLGYDTVNLNLGCPSGTVVSKKRGAGMLSDLEFMKNFLDEIFDKCQCRISIKTRIGIEDVAEWDELLKVYKNYPMEELIIHPRLQKEFYRGSVHPDAYSRADEVLDVPLCYNGDITSLEKLDEFKEALPEDLNRVMIGRGLISTPQMLVRDFDLSTFRNFHDEIYHAYQDCMSGCKPTLFKMKELWAYWISNFTDEKRPLKKIQKANHFKDYEEAVACLFTI